MNYISIILQLKKKQTPNKNKAKLDLRLKRMWKRILAGGLVGFYTSRNNNKHNLTTTTTILVGSSFEYF